MSLPLPPGASTNGQCAFDFALGSGKHMTQRPFLSIAGHMDAFELNKQRIQSKQFLKKYYQEVYNKFVQCVQRSPNSGAILELGSGSGFIKSYLPEAITSEVEIKEGIDQVVDATQMPFEDESLRTILMFDVFHHIPNVKDFLKEAQRCLVSGGRIFMVEPYPGFPGTLVYKYVHHEDFNMKVKEWSFPSDDPLNDANGALPWIVFERDVNKFNDFFPNLKIQRIQPHSPFRYWVSGGLKSWSLAPGSAFPFLSWIDNTLSGFHSGLASFVDIEIVKTGEGDGENK